MGTKPPLFIFHNLNNFGNLKGDPANYRYSGSPLSQTTKMKSILPSCYDLSIALRLWSWKEQPDDFFLFFSASSFASSFVEAESGVNILPPSSLITSRNESPIFRIIRFTPPLFCNFLQLILKCHLASHFQCFSSAEIHYVLP